jgi:thioredoxin-like negative regulator of GroEL
MLREAKCRKSLGLAILAAVVLQSLAAAEPLAADPDRLKPGIVNHFPSVADFDSVVVPQSRVTPVVVDFYASWCGPCERLAPVLDQLAHEFTGRLTFISVETSRDFDDPLTTRFSVKSIPMLVVITKDQPPGLVSGAMPIAQLREIFRSYLLEASSSNTATATANQ